MTIHIPADKLDQIKVTTSINGLEIGEATTFSDVMNHIGIPSVPFEPMKQSLDFSTTMDLDPITKQQFTSLFGKPMHNPEKEAIITYKNGATDSFKFTKYRQVLLTEKITGRNFARPVFNRVWQFRMNVKSKI